MAELCMRGLHPMEGDNLGSSGSGKKRCKACEYERVQGWKRERRDWLAYVREHGNQGWVTARAGDGPKVAAWIRTHIPELNDETDPSGARRVTDWRNGTRVDVFTLDKILTRHGRHLIELPDEVWIEGSAHARAA